MALDAVGTKVLVEMLMFDDSIANVLLPEPADATPAAKGRVVSIGEEVEIAIELDDEVYFNPWNGNIVRGYFAIDEEDIQANAGRPEAAEPAV